MLRVEWDDAEKAIVIGEAKFKSFRNWKSRKDFAYHVLMLNDTHCVTSGHPKDVNKRVCEAIGSTTHIYRMVKGLQYKKFVVPYKDILTKVAFSRGRINCEALHKIQKHEPLLREAYNDKLYNLLPIIMETGMSPKELKRVCGNVWKKIATNSLHRNKLIAREVRFDRRPQGFDYKKFFTTMQEIPSSVLAFYGGLDAAIMQHVKLHYKGKWGTYDKKIVDIVKDTSRLAYQLGRTVDYTWTPRRMKEEHDAMSKEITLRHNSPETIECLNGVLVKSFEYEGYLATLLMSKYEIAQEGIHMGHCVGGYVSSVASGDYLVYSVTMNGERSSTIGIRVQKFVDPKLRGYSLNQQYGKYNELIKNDNEQQIASNLVKLLNESDVK